MKSRRNAEKSVLLFLSSPWWNGSDTLENEVRPSVFDGWTSAIRRVPTEWVKFLGFDPFFKKGQGFNHFGFLNLGRGIEGVTTTPPLVFIVHCSRWYCLKTNLNIYKKKSWHPSKNKLKLVLRYEKDNTKRRW